MSFGLDIETIDGEWIEVVDGHTYNLAPMWRKALPNVLGGGSTNALEGWSCAALQPHLDKGLLDAVKNRHEYQELDPANGWGDYEGFIQIYSRFAHLNSRHPGGVVHWNG